MHIHSKNKCGFTLVEMSFVLVIIAFLVGGILVGRDLIKAAELRAQASEMQKLDSALNTFKVKFNELAGDMMDASSFGLTNGCQAYGNNGNGNGDGILNYCVQGCTFGQEVEDRKVFCHLANANLWPYNNGIGGPFVNTGGPYTSYCWNSACSAVPSTVVSTRMIVANATSFGISPTLGPAQGFYFYYSDTSTPTNHLVSLTFMTSEAYAIDLKIDDGLPNSGRVTAWGIDSAPPTSGASGSANCVNTSATPDAYNLLYTATTVCSLGFKMDAYQ